MFRLIGAGLLGLALLLNVVGVATKGWISTSFGGWAEINMQVTAAFNILGDLALIAAITLSIINHNNKTEGTQGKSGGIVGLVAGVLIVIGVGNFTRAYSPLIGHSSDVTFGYSFGLAWTSFVLAMVGGGLSMKTD